MDETVFRPVDATDAAILTELARDSRVSMSDLAAKVKLSRAHCYRKVDSLVASGLIRSFTVDVDPEISGLKVAAVILVETVQDRWAEVHEMVRAMAGVQFAAATTGQFDMALVVRVESMEELRETVLGRLALAEGVRTSRTLVVLDEIVSGRVVLPEARP